MRAAISTRRDFLTTVTRCRWNDAIKFRFAALSSRVAHNIRVVGYLNKVGLYLRESPRSYNYNRCRGVTWSYASICSYEYSVRDLLAAIRPLRRRKSWQIQGGYSREFQCFLIKERISSKLSRDAYPWKYLRRCLIRKSLRFRAAITLYMGELHARVTCIWKYLGVLHQSCNRILRDTRIARNDRELIGHACDRST